MSKTLPTVAVNRGGHRAIINQSDFDPSVDTLWSEPHAKEQTERIQRQVKAEQRQVKAETPEETKTPPALALINGKDVARDVAIIPTLGQVAAGIILERRPDGGYESLSQVWDMCPDVLGGRMKVDPKVVEEWGGKE